MKYGAKTPIYEINQYWIWKVHVFWLALEIGWTVKTYYGYDSHLYNKGLQKSNTVLKAA